ncbi:MAG: N-acetylmuramoyl-L-alanine amidase [Paracoccaceae bacterium]
MDGDRNHTANADLPAGIRRQHGNPASPGGGYGGGRLMRPIKGIIIHCTATRPEWREGQRTSAKVAEVKRWHLDRGFRDIGYHFLIDRDGTVAKGRSVSQTGAHVAGHNTGTIGISLFGGHGSASTDEFFDNFTPAQDKALRKMLGDMASIYKNPKVSGHNQWAAKACPGFNVPAWLDERAPDAEPAATAPFVPVQRPSGLWAWFRGLWC